MDWSSEAERRMLERIVAFLLSLAGLCDRAARLPALLRLPLLAILGYGESVARDYVWDLAWEAGRPVYVDESASLDDGKAERLAAAFRALALTLDALLAWAGHPARSHGFATRVSAGSTTPERGRSGLRGWWARLVPAPDTS